MLESSTGAKGSALFEARFARGRAHLRRRQMDEANSVLRRQKDKTRRAIRATRDGKVTTATTATLEAAAATELDPASYDEAALSYAIRAPLYKSATALAAANDGKVMAARSTLEESAASMELEPAPHDEEAAAFELTNEGNHHGMSDGADKDAVVDAFMNPDEDDPCWLVVIPENISPGKAFPVRIRDIILEIVVPDGCAGGELLELNDPEEAMVQNSRQSHMTTTLATQRHAAPAPATKGHAVSSSPASKGVGSSKLLTDVLVSDLVGLADRATLRSCAEDDQEAFREPAPSSQRAMAAAGSPPARVQSFWEAPRVWAENVFAQQQPQLATVVEDAVAANAVSSTSSATKDSKPCHGALQAEALNDSEFTERGSLLERSEARVFLTACTRTTPSDKREPASVRFTEVSMEPSSLTSLAAKRLPDESADRDGEPANANERSSLNA